ncbi:MAG: hypothetical protein AAF213_13450 [Pseudomonadota bacterium]
MVKHRFIPKPFTRPAAASGFADTESGNEGESVSRELYALNAMFERGLIPKDDYEARKAELEAAAADDGSHKDEAADKDGSGTKPDPSPPE